MRRPTIVTSGTVEEIGPRQLSADYDADVWIDPAERADHWSPGAEASIADILVTRIYDVRAEFGDPAEATPEDRAALEAAAIAQVEREWQDGSWEPSDDDWGDR